MKISPSPWQFAPKKLTPEKPAEQISPEERQRQNLQQLRAEHPWMSRGVEVLQMGSWIAQDQSVNAPWKQGSGALSAVTALASGAWGINKLAHGETTLDRVEGIGHLALAVDSAATSVGKWMSPPPWTQSVATPAVLVAVGCELTLGTSDLIRGLREDDSPRKWLGAVQIVSAASLAASLAFPGASGLAQAVVLMTTAARQSILGS